MGTTKSAIWWAAYTVTFAVFILVTFVYPDPDPNSQAAISLSVAMIGLTLCAWPWLRTGLSTGVFRVGSEVYSRHDNRLGYNLMILAGLMPFLLTLGTLYMAVQALT